MNDTVANSEPNLGTHLDEFAVREHEARTSLRSWLKANPTYTYQSFIERLSEPTDKSTISIWLSGKLSATTSRKARLIMEAAEELMVAPTGDKTIVEGRYDREPIDDDDRYLMNLVHELRAMSRQLCKRFPVRLVHLAGKYAVPARNLIERDRTAGCGNVLAYMHDGMEYATAENISESSLRLAAQRSIMLREAGLEVFGAYAGGDREFAQAKFLNYDGSLRARAAIILRDRQAFDDAMDTLVQSLDHPSRTVDGIHVNIIEVLDGALAADLPRATHWIDVVMNAGQRVERHQRMFTRALSQRTVSCLNDSFNQYAPRRLGQEQST